MVITEIRKPNNPGEVILKEGDGSQVYGFKGCKNMNQVYAVALSKASKSKNEEIRQVILSLQMQHKRFYPETPKEAKLIKIELKNWKGQGELYLGKTYEDDFIITEFIKNKDNGIVEEKERIIKHEDVNHLSKLLSQVEIGQKLNYKQIVRMIINSRSLPVTLDAFNGGKNRADFYFPYYYFPLKVLEERGVITYHGRGGVTRLN